MQHKICFVCFRGDKVVHKYSSKNYILNLDIVPLTDVLISGKILFPCNRYFGSYMDECVIYSFSNNIAVCCII